MASELPPIYDDPEVQFLLSLKERLELDIEGINARLNLLIGKQAVRHLVLVKSPTEG